MKPNRQVVQCLEGCSKEGLSYLNGSSTRKQSKNVSPNVVVPSTVNTYGMGKLRHLDASSGSLFNYNGISFDSPYRSLYLKFKKAEANQASSSPTQQIEKAEELFGESHSFAISDEISSENEKLSWLQRLRNLSIYNEASDDGVIEKTLEHPQGYGHETDRHTAIYKKYTTNPRFMEMKDYSDFKLITKAQEVTMAMTLVGVMIPVWALNSKKRFRATNTKLWVAFVTAHLCVVGVNSFFNIKYRGFLKYVDKKYFSQLPLEKIAKA